MNLTKNHLSHIKKNDSRPVLGDNTKSSHWFNYLPIVSIPTHTQILPHIMSDQYDWVGEYIKRLEEKVQDIDCTLEDMHHTYESLQEQHDTILEVYGAHLRMLDEVDKAQQEERQAESITESQRSKRVWMPVTAQSEAVKAEERRHRRERLKAKMLGGGDAAKHGNQGPQE